MKKLYLTLLLPLALVSCGKSSKEVSKYEFVLECKAPQACRIAKSAVGNYTVYEKTTGITYFTGETDYNSDYSATVNFTYNPDGSFASIVGVVPNGCPKAEQLLINDVIELKDGQSGYMGIIYTAHYSFYLNPYKIVKEMTSEIFGQGDYAGDYYVIRSNSEATYNEDMYPVSYSEKCTIMGYSPTGHQASGVLNYSAEFSYIF